MTDACMEQKTEFATYKERTDVLTKWMNEMRTNHLPHINSELTSIKIQMAYWGGGIAVLIFLASLFIKFL